MLKTLWNKLHIECVRKICRILQNIETKILEQLINHFIVATTGKKLSKHFISNKIPAKVFFRIATKLTFFQLFRKSSIRIFHQFSAINSNYSKQWNLHSRDPLQSELNLISYRELFTLPSSKILESFLSFVPPNRRTMHHRLTRIVPVSEIRNLNAAADYAHLSMSLLATIPSHDIQIGRRIQRRKSNRLVVKFAGPQRNRSTKMSLFLCGF